MNAKEIKRIDWRIVQRLVYQLYYNREEKRTNLAMKCNLSYDKFVMYLKWLDFMGLISSELDQDGYEVFKLNHRGIDLFFKIQTIT